MAIYESTPPIVTNGLVLALDVANPKSYVSGSNTWRDLSGNNYSGSFPIGIIYDFYNGVPALGFNATTQHYVSTNFTFPQQSISSSFSINAWYVPEFQVDTIIAGYRGPGSTYYKVTAQKFEMSPAEVFLQSTLSRWNNKCAVWDGATFGTNTNNMKYYHNSLSTPTLNTNTTPPYVRDEDNPTFFSGNMPFYVGGDPTGNDYFQGYIGLVQVYNRALSASEVLQNYNALKNRFNLG